MIDLIEAFVRRSLIAIPIPSATGGMTKTFCNPLVSANRNALYRLCAYSILFFGAANLNTPIGVGICEGAIKPSPACGNPVRNTLAFGE